MTDHTQHIHASERIMLVLSAVFIGINALALTLVRSGDLSIWLTVLTWASCAVAGHRVLGHYLPERDPLLFPLAMLLSGWGLVQIDRLAPVFADRQTIWLVVAVVAMLFSAIFPFFLRWLRQYRYLLLSLGLALLISTILLGQNPSGSGPQLWLGFGGIFFQPSEAMKIILVAFLASYLSEQISSSRISSLEGESARWLSSHIVGPIFLMWGLSIVLLIWQRDLGTAVLFFAVFITLLYVATGYTSIITGGFLLIVVAGAMAYLVLNISLVQLRIDIWLNPWPEASDRAYQVVQSLMAFGSGGVFGQGIGQGSASYIPVAHSDFAFAALAEEWGLHGVISAIVMIATITVRGLGIAILHNERPFYALMATGLSALLAIQSLLILGGVLKMLPLTGVTLPFVSYGGSSLLMCFIAIGILLRLSAGVR